jgi:hypothetical protein
MRGFSQTAMKTIFTKNNWNLEELTYAYSYRFEETPAFIQKEDCVENTKNPDAVYGFDNISLLSRKKFGPGTKLSTRCAFEDLGAPLLVIADKLETDPRGVVRYGDYLEVVLWKNGVNVWRMWMEHGEVTWKQLMGVEFAVSEHDIHTLSVTIEKDTLHIRADDHIMQLCIDQMYDSYHLGINACEGINRFYDLEIE